MIAVLSLYLSYTFAFLQSDAIMTFDVFRRLRSHKDRHFP